MSLPLGSGPDVVPMQPKPLGIWINHARVGSVEVTAMTRRWADGDSGPGGLCRLCSECTAHGGVCLITVVGKHVPAPDVPLFSLASLGDAREQFVGLPAVQRVGHG